MENTMRQNLTLNRLPGLSPHILFISTLLRLPATRLGRDMQPGERTVLKQTWLLVPPSVSLQEHERLC